MTNRQTQQTNRSCDYHVINIPNVGDELRPDEDIEADAHKLFCC